MRKRFVHLILAVYAIILFVHPLGELGHAGFHMLRGEDHRHQHGHSHTHAHPHAHPHQHAAPHQHGLVTDALLGMSAAAAAATADDNRPLRFWPELTTSGLASLALVAGVGLTLALALWAVPARRTRPASPPPRTFPS